MSFAMFLIVIIFLIKGYQRYEKKLFGQISFEECIKRYVKNWAWESGFVVENALVCVLWSEKNSPKHRSIFCRPLF